MKKNIYTDGKDAKSNRKIEVNNCTIFIDFAIMVPIISAMLKHLPCSFNRGQ